MASTFLPNSQPIAQARKENKLANSASLATNFNPSFKGFNRYNYIVFSFLRRAISALMCVIDGLFTMIFSLSVPGKLLNLSKRIYKVTATATSDQPAEK